MTDKESIQQVQLNTAADPNAVNQVEEKRKNTNVNSDDSTPRSMPTNPIEFENVPAPNNNSNNNNATTGAASSNAISTKDAAAPAGPATTAQTHKTTRVGPYFVGKTLGVGSTGRVKLGTHIETGKRVAIKILNKSCFKSGDLSSKKVEREIAIMKLVQHPNVMALYDVYESKDEFMVLELVEGGELFDYLVKKGRLPENEALSFFQQIIQGVDFCHQHLIFHRDLKPENLLLDSTRQTVKIADFGMASLQPTGKLLETSCGSPHYACPEIIKGERYHGGPADIWSCGVILFALLTGNLPFDDENIRRLLIKVKSGKFAIPAEVSSQARDLITRMMQVNPRDRITMDEILIHPWFTSNKIQVVRTIPVYKQLKDQMPKLSKQDIDPEIISSLKMLGWENETHLLSSLEDEEDNLEKVFYFLLLQRKLEYLENHEYFPHESDDRDAPKRRAQSSTSLYSSSLLSIRSGNVSLNDLSIASNNEKPSGEVLKKASTYSASSAITSTGNAILQQQRSGSASASTLIPDAISIPPVASLHLSGSRKNLHNPARISSPLSKSEESVAIINASKGGTAATSDSRKSKIAREIDNGMEVSEPVNKPGHSSSDGIVPAHIKNNSDGNIEVGSALSTTREGSTKNLSDDSVNSMMSKKKQALTIDTSKSSNGSAVVAAAFFGTPKFHRRRDDILLPSPILASAISPKKSWFSSLFNFKAESITFLLSANNREELSTSSTDGSNIVTLAQITAKLEAYLKELHVKYQERKEIYGSLKCMVEYDDGKVIKFKIDTIVTGSSSNQQPPTSNSSSFFSVGGIGSSTPTSSNTNPSSTINLNSGLITLNMPIPGNCVKIQFTLQQGLVSLFKDACQQFSDACCTRDNWLRLETLAGIGEEPE